MIVNPQLFNYRLIIISLMIVLAVLGIFSFTNYKSTTSYEEFLQQEKSLIEKELSEMLTSYDDLSENYNLITTELQAAKLETKTALDSLRVLNSDLSIITKFKNQLVVLKTNNKILLSTIDSLNSVNVKLEEEKRYALNKILERSQTINGLEDLNRTLNKTKAKASTLKINSVTAEAFIINNNNKKSTIRARSTNAIDVCIALAENTVTETGYKDLFIQILSPNNNSVLDKGEIVFNSNSLIYSLKEAVSFDNKNLNICTTIATYKADRPLVKGQYIINVFHENNKLGSTTLKLK